MRPKIIFLMSLLLSITLNRGMAQEEVLTKSPLFSDIFVLKNRMSSSSDVKNNWVAGAHKKNVLCDLEKTYPDFKLSKKQNTPAHPVCSYRREVLREMLDTCCSYSIETLKFIAATSRDNQKMICEYVQELLKDKGIEGEQIIRQQRLEALDIDTPINITSNFLRSLEQKEPTSRFCFINKEIMF